MAVLFKKVPPGTASPHISCELSESTFRRILHNFALQYAKFYKNRQSGKTRNLPLANSVLVKHLDSELSTIHLRSTTKITEYHDSRWKINDSSSPCFLLVVSLLSRVEAGYRPHDNRPALPSRRQLLGVRKQLSCHFFRGRSSDSWSHDCSSSCFFSCCSHSPFLFYVRANDAHAQARAVCSSFSALG